MLKKEYNSIMRELVLILIMLFFLTPTAHAAKSKNPDGYIPNVFIYEIPDDDEETKPMIEEIGSTELNTNTAVKSPVLKTEIQYFDNLDVVNLDKTANPKAINISKPQKISANSLKDYNKKLEANKAARVSNKVVQASYRGDEESWISGNYKGIEEKVGAFSFGTNYSSEVSSLSSLEYSSGLFTKYQKKNFALKTQVYKEQVATYGLTTNNISIAPEYRFNKALAIKNVLKADLTRERKTAQLILLLTPFAYKGNERFNLELGAGQTYDDTNSLMRTKFEFSTKLEL